MELKLSKNSSASTSIAPVFERCLWQLCSSIAASWRVAPLTSSIPSKGNGVVDNTQRVHVYTTQFHFPKLFVWPPQQTSQADKKKLLWGDKIQSSSPWPETIRPVRNCKYSLSLSRLTLEEHYRAGGASEWRAGTDQAQAELQSQERGCGSAQMEQKQRVLAPGTAAAGTPRAWKDTEEESLLPNKGHSLGWRRAALRGEKGDSNITYWSLSSVSNSWLQTALVQLRTCCAFHLAYYQSAAALLEKPQIPIAKPFHWIAEALKQGKCCFPLVLQHLPVAFGWHHPSILLQKQVVTDIDWW